MIRASGSSAAFRSGSAGQSEAAECRAGFYKSISEIEHALQEKALTLHAKIKYRWDGLDADGKPVQRWYETTPGRAMLGEVLPKSSKVPFDVVNKLMTKREISNMIDTVYRHCGQKDTVIFCDRIMALGFYHAFKAGISFARTTWWCRNPSGGSSRRRARS